MNKLLHIRRLLTAALLGTLLIYFRVKRAGIRRWAALAQFLLSVLLLAVLLDYTYNTIVVEAPETIYDFENRLFSLP